MATEVRKKAIVSRSSSRVNEIIAIILLAVAILIFLSLVSFNVGDSTPNTASSQKTQNWVGLVGAVTADLLFQIIGLTAYVLPAVLALIAWRVFRSVSLYTPLSRIIGFILLVGSISGLLSIWLSLGFRGGMLGAVISGGLLYLIGNVGSVIVLVALLLASILLITNLSYLAAVTGFQLAFDNFKIHFNERFNRFRNWREANKAEAKLRSEKRRETLREKEAEVPKPSEKPTISVGETPVSQPVPVAEKIEEKTIETESDEVSKPRKIEDLRPQIIIPEEVSPTRETDDLPPILETEPEEIKDDKYLIAEDDLAEFPITPIQKTGDLQKIELEEVEADEPIVKRTEPQNFENYDLPTSDFLTAAPPRIDQGREEFYATARELTSKCAEFNVNGEVKHICQGPVVTTYEFKPDAGVKYSRITGLADDLCLALKAESIRIDRIPGKAYVGIEVPNQNRETIFLREVIESKKFEASASLLSIALGKTIDGLNYVADLAKMPHLLIAGATGAGKSVGVNTLVVSILYKAKPDEVKFIMVDPKRLELGVYADIPHLATPIITDPKRATISLKWAVSEMERRYKELAGWGVRNIDGYNAEVKRRNEIEHFDDDGEAWKRLPYIVIIIDELADLMMVAGKEVEESITRLAQMARAVGIHLVLATQRPSVDVITGLIKANFPARISFRVSSKIDSRTIIDANGAERLLGKGDMLYLPPATSQIVRVHGAFVDEKEIAKIVEHIKTQGNPEYDTTITKTEEELDDSGDLPGKKDPLFMDALRSVVSAKRASTSGLQRHLRIGYGRAAAILDAMVKEGLIGEMDSGTRARPILEKGYEYLEAYDSADEN
jgi:S-DNA-T family DNA segregation ATPase FtsK/SpoIIIE